MKFNLTNGRSYIIALFIFIWIVIYLNLSIINYRASVAVALPLESALKRKIGAASGAGEGIKRRLRAVHAFGVLDELTRVLNHSQWEHSSAKSVHSELQHVIKSYHDKHS